MFHVRKLLAIPLKCSNWKSVCLMSTSKGAHKNERCSEIDRFQVSNGIAWKWAKCDRWCEKEEKRERMGNAKEVNLSFEIIFSVQFSINRKNLVDRLWCEQLNDMQIFKGMRNSIFDIFVYANTKLKVKREKKKSKQRCEILREMGTTVFKISLKSFIHFKWNVYCIHYTYISFANDGFVLDFVLRFVETLFWLHIKWWPCIVHHTLNGLCETSILWKWLRFARFLCHRALCLCPNEIHFTVHSDFRFSFLVLWVVSCALRVDIITFWTYSAILSVGSVVVFFLLLLYLFRFWFYSVLRSALQFRFV